MSTEIDDAIPGAVHDLLRTLWTGGHAAYVVGGSLRDTLLGRPAKDWDLATAALPERTVELFPGAVYENKFGTVAVRTATVPNAFSYTAFSNIDRVRSGSAAVVTSQSSGVRPRSTSRIDPPTT